MLAIQVPTLIRRVASPISCVVARASLFDLGGKDRVETCIFRLDCDCLDFGSAPPRAGNDPETQPLRHPRSPFVYLLRGHYPGRQSAETPF